MQHEIVQPGGWPRPKGYSNGIVVPAGQRLLFVAGQIAWDERQQLVGKGDFAAQFAQSLRNVAAVVRAAGGTVNHVVQMTVYVTDKQQYLAAAPRLGAIWSETMGKQYPTMALVQVADLLEPGALVEISATAALPPTLSTRN